MTARVFGFRLVRHPLDSGMNPRHPHTRLLDLQVHTKSLNLQNHTRSLNPQDHTSFLNPQDHIKFLNLQDLTRVFNLRDPHKFLNPQGHTNHPNLRARLSLWVHTKLLKPQGHTSHLTQWTHPRHLNSQVRIRRPKPQTYIKLLLYHRNRSTILLNLSPLTRVLSFLARTNKLLHPQRRVIPPGFLTANTNP